MKNMKIKNVANKEKWAALRQNNNYDYANIPAHGAIYEPSKGDY